MRLLASGLILSLITSAAWGAGEIEVARASVSTVFRRLASVPPTSANLESWAQEFVAAADPAAERAVLLKVADAAIQNDNFYSRTVLNFAEPETNENEELTDALSDYTATIVGMIKDDKDYRQILHGDIIYIPNPAVIPTPYAPNNNDAYTELHQQVRLGAQPLGANLQESTQSAVTGFPIQAGIYTTRGFGSVYYNDGTNRAPVRYTFMHYICRDMELLSDITRPDVYVRRDVDRSPGGDGEKFRTECVGCHSGMDPHTNAFSFLDFDVEAEQMTYSNTAVPKVNRNADTFPNGYVVENDAWLNIWYEGSNANLGWNPEMKSGNGPKSWGESIATTTMFPECMAKRVYETVCFKTLLNKGDKANITALTKEFIDGGYKMKTLFKGAAVSCVDNINF